jgi:hypothetical protein
MNRILFLGIGFALSIMCQIDRTDAETVAYTWEYDRYRAIPDRTREPLSPINYYRTENKLRIDDGDEIVIVDYADSKLFRCDSARINCTVFDLSPEPNLPSQPVDINTQTRTALAELMGSMKVTPGNETQVVNTIPCRKLFVSFGNRINMARTVVPLEIQALGRKFRAHTAVYWVSKKIPVYDELFKLDAQSAVFKSCPLLRQIDPLGLFPFLDGFPVSIEQTDKNGQLTIFMLKTVKRQKLDPQRFTP